MVPPGITIEHATIADAPVMHALITVFADRDEMLHRPLSEIYENLRDFWVARAGGEAIGCVSLHLLWGDLAEIKSLAVRDDCQAQGLGAALVRACLADARAIGLPKVFALTYKPGFFERLGFEQADVMAFPRKVWGECYRCPKFPTCTEIAVSIDLTKPASIRASHATDIIRVRGKYCGTRTAGYQRLQRPSSPRAGSGSDSYKTGQGPLRG